MLKTTALMSVSLILISAFATAADSKTDTKSQATKSPSTVGRNHSIGNREHPTETQIQALCKSFCVALRRFDGSDSRREKLQSYIDPRYLQTHDLQAGSFPVTTVKVGPIHNIQIAADGRTVACEVGTKDNQKELLLLSVTVHQRKLYLTPHAAPDAKTGSVTPWILRMVVQTATARASGSEFAEGQYSGAGQLMLISDENSINYDDTPPTICHLEILADDKVKAEFPDPKLGRGKWTTMTLDRAAREPRSKWSRVVGETTYSATATPYSAGGYLFRLEVTNNGKLIAGAQQFFAMSQK